MKDRVTRDEVFREAQASKAESLASVRGKVPGSMLEVPSFRDCIIAGGWLNGRLRDLGLTEEKVFEIGFAHGQRAVFGDAYEWAARYYNAALVGDYPTPGLGLAEEINREVFEAE